MPTSERKGVDMTTGAIAPKLLHLAWPLVLGNLLQTAYNLADLFWVGQVGRDPLAAVSLMFPLTWLFISTAIGLTAATIALVSQYVGADEQRNADEVVSQTILLALFVSTVLASLGWIFRYELLTLIGAEGAVFDESLDYIEVIFFALPLTFLFFAFRSSLQGAGDTKTAMWLVFISAGINVVLDPFLILGWGPFPAMGTRGAAWATFIARAFAAAAGIYILLQGSYGVKLYLRDLRPNPAVLKQLINIGYPATLDGWTRSFAAVVIAAFVAPFGAAAIAAYGIGVRLMSVTWTVAGAIGDATSTGVGQNLGAETPERARRVTWVATAATMTVLTAATLGCLVFAEPLMELFTDDAETIAEGVRFLYIVAPVWALFGGTLVIQGAFRGAGQTKVSLALSLLARWLFRVPVAVVVAFSTALSLPGIGSVELGLGIGVAGIWISFAVGATLTFLVAVFWFSLGRWTEGVIDSGDAAGEPAGETKTAKRNGTHSPTEGRDPETD